MIKTKGDNMNKELSPQDIFKLVDKLKENEFKNYSFISWECGLNSTERKNIARIRKLLDLLDELNRNNIKNDTLFYFCSQLIKDVLSKDYEIMGNEKNTYTMRRIKK
jgi:hypothetical protein